MKPLLKPTGKPHPDLLKNAIGICGISTAINSSDYQVAVESIIMVLKTIVGADKISLESSQKQGNASLRTYVFSMAKGNAGNVQFSYGGKDNFTMNAALFWSFLPRSIERVIAGVDRVWDNSKWWVLYAYDWDDFTLQNCTMALGLENWGLTRDQLEFINRYGIVEEIDTRGNPGFMLNFDGLFWTVQWLNYWSKAAQNRILAENLRELPARIEIRDMGEDALCIRLGIKPGLFDDVEFHQLQMKARRVLPFRPPFAIHD